MGARRRLRNHTATSRLPDAMLLTGPERARHYYSRGYNVDPSRPRELLESLRGHARQFGARSAARLVIQYAAIQAAYRSAHQGRTFTVGGRTYPYFDRPVSTERAVEVPMGLAQLAKSTNGDRILEVGNVLGRYGAPPHDVVDRYELAPGVINEDVTAFSPRQRYDSIISISTLEHVGFDERPEDPSKFERAITQLLDGCLSDGGEIFLTLPLRYNPAVDAWFAAACHGLGACAALQRTGPMNLWEETPVATALSARTARRFGERFPGAEFLGIWRYPAD